ncbi:LCP family protein [uncultured Acetatifactor sp.]|uniref:LCP family protein n=1 Tax=uncultured Acetatifactor sp. TaxID=1671927 RepID=UPI0026363AD8|nr:LCP family protein [uncultured Acetatifactor sp.]
MDDSTNKNEMEQIQRGLEAFLEKEMDSAQNSQEGRRRNGQGAGHAKAPGEIDLIGQPRDRNLEQARRRWQPDREEPYQSYQAEEPMDEAPYQSRRSGNGGYTGRYDQWEEDEPYINRRDEDNAYYQDDWDTDGRYDDRDSRNDDDADFYQDDWDGETEKTHVTGRRQWEPNGRRRQYEEESYGRNRRYEGEESGRRNYRYEEEEPYRRSRRYEEEQPRRSRRYEEEEQSRRSRRYEEEEQPRRSRGYEEEEPYRGSGRYEEEDAYPRRQSGEVSSRKGGKAYGEEPSGKSQDAGRRQSRKKGKSREAEPPREEGSRMSKKKQKQEKASKKKPRKKKHRLLKFLIGAAVLVALLGFGLYQLVGVVYGKMTYREIAEYTALPMETDGVVNILLIGNDSRKNGEDGRSDAMILLSVSSKTKKIYMTSLLRDMYVDIPGHDGNRLNAAYSYGGPELLMETIRQNFGLPVNRYMLVNFGAFVNLVDEVGGIDLELSNDEVIWVNNYLVEYNILTENPQGTFELDPNLSGMVHLNGPQALAYTRNRFLGTDFGRTERQRKVLTAVIGKLPSAALTNMGGLIDGLMPNLTTNLTRGECFRLSLMAGKLISYEIVSDSIPQPGTYKDVTIRKMQVLEVDFEENIRYLKEKLYGE